MWLVIVIVLGLVLALIGLLAVAKELFRESSLDANCMDSEGATARHDLACARERHREMTP
jgi:hypothetical protein